MKNIIFILVMILGLGCSTYMGVGKGTVVLQNGETIPYQGKIFFEQDGDMYIFGSNGYPDAMYENKKIREIHLVK